MRASCNGNRDDPDELHQCRRSTELQPMTDEAYQREQALLRRLRSNNRAVAAVAAAQQQRRSQSNNNNSQSNPWSFVNATTTADPPVNPFTGERRIAPRGGDSFTNGSIADAVNRQFDRGLGNTTTE